MKCKLQIKYIVLNNYTVRITDYYKFGRVTTPMNRKRLNKYKWKYTNEELNGEHSTEMDSSSIKQLGKMIKEMMLQKQ